MRWTCDGHVAGCVKHVCGAWLEHAWSMCLTCCGNGWVILGKLLESFQDMLGQQQHKVQIQIAKQLQMGSRVPL